MGDRARRAASSIMLTWLVVDIGRDLDGGESNSGSSMGSCGRSGR